MSAGPRSPIRTCWPMCAESSLSSARRSSGPTSAKTLRPSPAAKSAIRSQPARSARPRRRSRTTAWRNRSAATAAAMTGTTPSIVPPIAPVRSGHGPVPGTETCLQGPRPVRTWPGARHRDVSLKAEVLRNHHALHLVRALADLEDLLVAVEARDRELLHEAVPAVDLQCGVHHPVREEPCEELRLSGGEAERPALVLEPRGAVDELPPGLDLRRHVGELELDRLEARDRPAELVPLLRVGGGEVVRTLRQPDAHRGDRDAAAVEDLEELV